MVDWYASLAWVLRNRYAPLLTEMSQRAGQGAGRWGTAQATGHSLLLSFLVGSQCRKLGAACPFQTALFSYLWTLLAMYQQWPGPRTA